MHSVLYVLFYQQISSFLCKSRSGNKVHYLCKHPLHFLFLSAEAECSATISSSIIVNIMNRVWVACQSGTRDTLLANKRDSSSNNGNYLLYLFPSYPTNNYPPHRTVSSPSAEGHTGKSELMGRIDRNKKVIRKYLSVTISIRFLNPKKDKKNRFPS